MKVIRDSIHGDIRLMEHEIKIVDTPEFQRLRRIKQLGMTYLVYPSANHTRFEHSLGVMHIAGRIAKKLGLEEEENNLIRLAALLHDIGHCPLSHSSERLLLTYLNTTHEALAKEIILNSKIKDILRDYGYSEKEVIKILEGKRGYLSKIISSSLDADRMDYLVRDAHHTGVAYGIIDLDRIITTIEIKKNMLVVEHGGLHAVEALLVARFLMMPTVYLHHTSRIADAMFLKAMEISIEEKLLNSSDLWKMDDYSIICFLRNCDHKYQRDIARRLDTRNLFKLAYSKRWRDIHPSKRRKLIKDLKLIRKLEQEIAESCDLEYGYVIVDVPPIPKKEEIDVKILKNGEIISIERESKIAKILKNAQKDLWSFEVYTPRRYVEKVRKVCDDILGV